jgi:hypothetical protein
MTAFIILLSVLLIPAIAAYVFEAFVGFIAELLGFIRVD